jgi:hypothetical protein
MGELLRRHAGHVRRDRPQRQQPGGDDVRLAQPGPPEVVVPAERDRAPPGREAVELEVLERQPAEVLDQVPLFGGPERVRPVREPLG